MKKSTLLLSCMLMATMLCLNGCILDALKNVKQNMSLNRTFFVAGNTNNIPKQSSSIRLSDSQVYLDNKGKIKGLAFKAAALCVTALDKPALQGDITLTLKNGSIVLFNKVLTGFKPADYKGIQAKDIPLTQAETDAINAVLSSSNMDSILFTGELSVANATPANTTVSMACFISLAIEMTVEL